MLLFIPIKYIPSFKSPCFNTSHVVIYLVPFFKLFLVFRVSIHLMLLFICLIHLISHVVINVSIHLMLLFISSDKVEINLTQSVSIHLMLLFIVDDVIMVCSVLGFQYISCCYLSEKRSEE